MWLGDQRQGPAVLPREITRLSGTGSWAPQPVWTGMEKRHFFPSPGFKPRTFQPLLSYYTD
jgi:hypothetical protein